MVKSRAATITTKRIRNLHIMEGEAPPETGLYGIWQTEIYIPPPVVDVPIL